MPIKKSQCDVMFYLLNLLLYIAWQFIEDLLECVRSDIVRIFYTTE